MKQQSLERQNQERMYQWLTAIAAYVGTTKALELLWEVGVGDWDEMGRIYDNLQHGRPATEHREPAPPCTNPGDVVE